MKYYVYICAREVEACTQEAEKCSYCREDLHDLHKFPVYKRRIRKESCYIVMRFKKTYAEMLKALNPPAKVILLLIVNQFGRVFNRSRSRTFRLNSY